MAQSKKQPELHPTRRKVLAGVAELSRDGSWTFSSAVRKKAGISQQLLNRHLRALEVEGLVSLVNPGPGRPLKARVTRAGLSALGQSASLPQDPPESEPAQESPATPLATPERGPVIRLSKRVYLFLESLYIALTPFMRDLDRIDYYQAVGPAMHMRPVKTALYQALSPYLVGLGPVELEQIVARLLNAQPRPPQPGAQSRAQQQPRVRSASMVSGQEPLVLNSTEAALEERLTGCMNQAYQGMAWHQRTRLLSDEWDRTRRRRLGLFRTMFSSFDPRWQRPDWADFNQARRQADYCGADYAGWVAAQFEELSPHGQSEVLPKELYGKRALTAYQEYCAAESA